MKLRKLVVATLVAGSTLTCIQAIAAKGTYWETRIKVDMVGSPLQKPGAPTEASGHPSKECLSDDFLDHPEKEISEEDSDCKVTDVKKGSNKLTWKATCNRDGDISNETNEMTWSASSYHFIHHAAGTLGGKPFEATSQFEGSKIGGSCDPDEDEKEQE
jgi:hypothetical protein